jgi:hypothetical protein
MDRACATLRYATPELRSGEREHIAKNPQQWHIGWYVDVARLAIDIQCDHMPTLNSRSPVHSQKLYAASIPPVFPIASSRYAIDIINDGVCLRWLRS